MNGAKDEVALEKAEKAFLKTNYFVANFKTVIIGFVESEFTSLDRGPGV